jgi:hypothetical protein
MGNYGKSKGKIQSPWPIGGTLVGFGYPVYSLYFIGLKDVYII